MGTLVGIALSFIFRKGTITRRSADSRAMAEVSSGRCHALAKHVHECSVQVDSAKSTLALLRPSSEQFRRATAEGA